MIVESMIIEIVCDLRIKKIEAKKMEQINSYLGKDTVLEGKLIFKGTFNLDCNFKGNISAPGTLIVGEKGKINSNIHVKSIICKGEILGNIIAEERVEILSSGKVYGDIWVPVLVVKKGAIFEGNCLMNEVKVTRAGKPDAAVSKTSEVVQLYDSTRQKSKVHQLSEAC